MPITSADEPIEVFSAAGQHLGIEPRGEVHRRGLWHRSSHLFLYDRAGRLLLQQRSYAKDLYPNAWDYSVGEHLKPGETYLDAIQRGLTEELGIVLSAPTFNTLGGPTAAEYLSANGAQIDREFQQGYLARLPEDVSVSAIAADPEEITALRWLDTTQLRAWLANPAEANFTPWLLRDLERFALL